MWRKRDLYFKSPASWFMLYLSPNNSSSHLLRNLPLGLFSLICYKKKEALSWKFTKFCRNAPTPPFYIQENDLPGRVMQDGPITKINEFIQYYNHAEFGGFTESTQKWPLPTWPRRVTPREIWNGHEAKINQLVEYCYEAKFGAFNPKCTIISPYFIANHHSPPVQEKMIPRMNLGWAYS